MTTDQIAPPGGLLHGDPDRRHGHSGHRDEVATASLPDALRTAAHRRLVRAEALRAWSQDVRPLLAHSLRRRASELELGAVALELRADGMDGRGPAVAAGLVADLVGPARPPAPNEEEQR